MLNNRVYCDECVRPTGFDNVTLYHGFNAFHRFKPWSYKLNTLMQYPERQICTSTKFIGLMGVVVEGDILMASSYDLCSAVDKDTNRRHFHHRGMKHLVNDYSELELHEDDPDENNEIVITNVKIKGIWITSDAPNNLKEIAAKLAEENNLPLMNVGDSIFC